MAEAGVNRPLLSIVVPVHNEQDNLAELHRRVCAALDPVTRDYEFMLVDDGSRDDSVRVIESLRASDPRVGLVELSRNFGKELALIAGYDHAAGRAVVALDADLQTPPEVIPALIREWQAGAKIVDAVRTSTTGQGRLRTWASTGFYWALGKLSNTEITPNSVDFRLLDEQVVRELRRCRERYRFNRGLAGWLGFHHAHVEFTAGQRFGGRSRWSYYKLAAYALDAVFSFSSVPLRLAGLLGLAISLLSFVYLIIVIIARLFFTQPMPGYATVVGGIFLLGGVQLLTIWVLGEYVGRLYDEAKGRPLYVVRRVVPVGTAGPSEPTEPVPSPTAAGPHPRDVD
jgi:glycosyltransferase involved in cell wall biosynthesis